MEPSGPQPRASSAADPPRRRRAAALAGLLVALSCVPYLVGWLGTPPGHEFIPYRHINTVDVALNLAYLERARGGELLLRAPYSAGETRYFRPTYALLGGVGRVTGLSSGALFQLGRVAFGLLALLAVYRLALRLFERESARVAALLLAGAGSGLSWVVTVFDPAHPALVWPDSRQPEATLASSLLASPHLVAAWWLLVELAVRLIDGWRAPSWRASRAPFAAAAGALGLMLFDQPYNGPLALVLCLAVPAVFGGAAADLRRRALVAAGLLLPAAALPTAALAWTVSRDPGAGALIRQTASLSLGDVLGTFGLLWVWAALGAARLPRDSSWRLLVGWVAAQGVLLLLPVPLAFRFVEGWILPVALLGGAWLTSLGGRHGRWLAPAAVAVSVVGAVFVAGAQAQAYSRAGHAWRAPERARLYAWIAAHTEPGDLVLTDYRTGHELPGAAGCRVVYGHPYLGPLRDETVERLVADLEAARASGGPPRFAPPHQRIAFVVATRRVGEDLALALDTPWERAPRYQVRPWWAAPVFATPSAAVFAVPAP